MEITWYGHSCFRLSERGKAVVVTDPFSDSIGLAIPKLKADIVTVSHDAPGHNNIDAVKGFSRVVAAPGEYEIGGVFIIGAAMNNTTVEPPKRNVAYVFDFEGIKVAHLGDLDHVPPQSVVESMGAIQIVLVPVGGGGGLNATQAAEVVNLLEPRIVIPMHYNTDGSLLELETAERFLKEMGVSSSTQTDLLKVTPSSLPDSLQVTVMGVGK